MSQNGQTHFKNLAGNSARLLKCVDHSGTSCIKRLKLKKSSVINAENIRKKQNN